MPDFGKNHPCVMPLQKHPSSQKRHGRPKQTPESNTNNRNNKQLKTAAAEGTGPPV
jgi:hypothetical protein